MSRHFIQSSSNPLENYLHSRKSIVELFSEGGLPRRADTCRGSCSTGPLVWHMSAEHELSHSAPQGLRLGLTLRALRNTENCCFHRTRWTSPLQVFTVFLCDSALDELMASPLLAVVRLVRWLWPVRSYEDTFWVISDWVILHDLLWSYYDGKMILYAKSRTARP